jgi:hypothetical protein
MAPSLSADNACQAFWYSRVLSIAFMDDRFIKLGLNGLPG